VSKVIGIDILAGASSQKRTFAANRFAAVVMEDNNVIEKIDSLSLRNLIKLCRQYEPEFLGVDNIFELESNSARIIQFCMQLPAETKIIQVTGASPDGFEPLKRLARRYGIPYPSQHANPLQTAEVICRLAEKKVGYILLPFEDEIEIKISRGKNIGPGGWSQQRYARKMRGEVLTMTREIEKQLLDHNIDFDLEVKKAEYGYDNAIFRAYTNISTLRKIIKPYKGELSRVTVSPIRKKRLEYIPAANIHKKVISSPRRKTERGLIVGIDPGPNTGIAVLNFSGKILLVDSLRNAARGDIIRLITQFGKPIIVAADVTPPPDFVVKICRMVNAVLSYPEKLYSADEKNLSVDNFTSENERRIKGSHKRDALFAALKAYNKYKPIFEKINKELAEPKEISLRNKVKQIVLLEERNIQDAIQEVKNQLAAPEKELEIETPKDRPLTETEQILVEKIEALKEAIARQTIQIENLEDMNEKLTEKVRTLRKENKTLNHQIKRITDKQRQELKRERAIKTRDNELQFLRKKVHEYEQELAKVKRIISDLKRMIVMGQGDVVVPMKVVFDFSRKGIEKTAERMNIEPFDVILLVDPSGGGQRTAEMLIEREVKAIVCAKNNISNQALETFIQADVPVLFNLPIRQIDDIAVTYHKEFQEALAKWKEEREKILREKTEEKLEALIKNYKSYRKKELEQIFEAELRAKKERSGEKLARKPIKIIKAETPEEE